jgi:hypothetical protein
MPECIDIIVAKAILRGINVATRPSGQSPNVPIKVGLGFSASLIPESGKRIKLHDDHS